MPETISFLVNVLTDDKLICLEVNCYYLEFKLIPNSS